MKTFFSFLMLTTCAILTANDNGGIHIHTRDGEQIEADSTNPTFCMGMRPWYYHLWYTDCAEDIEEQADRLQDETSWPSQREDFSDYLMR